MPEIAVTCPACNFRFTDFALQPWGDGKQRGSHVVPFICSNCGGAALLNLVKVNLVALGPEALEMLKSVCPTLHGEIVAAQQRVRMSLRAEEGRG